MFSSRVPDDLTPNRVTQAVQRMRSAGIPFTDLTESNPTRVGLEYPQSIFEPLADRTSLVYTPEPLGLWSAREAVAAHLPRHGHGQHVAPEQIMLTSSTSDAYSLLFKLLCDPGDEVLVPRPSYPLFEHLTRLDMVTSVPYMLEHDGRWTIDIGRVAQAISPRTRAIFAVSPNNPTGSFLSVSELDELASLCDRHGLALIGDEVFRSYSLTAAARHHPSVLEQAQALTFSLGGLSKSVGLPHVKLGWIVLGGPDALVAEARQRLELICDTYLSVSTPVQHAASALLTAGQFVREQIHTRISRNLRALEEIITRAPEYRVLTPEGGWSAVVQVPATRSEEDMVIDFLERDRILVHPGYFFDFPCEAFFVISLLPEPEQFRHGISTLLSRLDH